MADNHITTDEFEKAFEESLKSIGHFFPTTDKEVEIFESLNAIEEIPAELDNINRLLQKDRKVYTEPKKYSLNNDTVENLARAARNGGEIAKEILKRMESDRNDSENK